MDNSPTGAKELENQFCAFLGQLGGSYTGRHVKVSAQSIFLGLDPIHGESPSW